MTIFSSFGIGLEPEVIPVPADPVDAMSIALLCFWKEDMAPNAMSSNRTVQPQPDQLLTQRGRVFNQLLVCLHR
jgi:hypothetical protein